MSVQLLGAEPHQVARLGGVAAIDSTHVSWCPAGVSGWQPINAYLIQRNGSAVLVDTGVGMHADDILEQLRAQLPAGASLSVVLTRTEMECCLNLPALESEFTVDQVWYTGGITVPVTHAVAKRISIDAGGSIDLEAAPGITLRLYSPLLRLLPVLWVGDPASGMLMTSDSFTHLLSDADGNALPYETSNLRAFHDLKFGWIADAVAAADITAIAENVRTIIHERKWIALGPTYGAPVIGVDSVRTQADQLADHLQEGISYVTA